MTEGEIRSDAVYTAKEFCRRTGMSRDNLRQFLKVHRLAHKPFVLGEDFIEAVKAAPTTFRHAGQFGAKTDAA